MKLTHLATARHMSMVAVHAIHGRGLPSRDRATSRPFPSRLASPAWMAMSIVNVAVCSMPLSPRLTLNAHQSARSSML